MELIDAPDLLHRAAHDSRRGAVVQKAHQSGYAGHPLRRRGHGVLQVYMGSGHRGKHTAFKTQRQAAPGDGHAGELLDRRDAAGAVLDLELEILIAELLAELPAELRDVAHRVGRLPSKLPPDRN